MLPTTNRMINGAENHYCGYCSKLIENFNNITNADDNNDIIFCTSCQGQFHLHCTALSTSPNKQTLTWKCNTCVARDAELPTQPTPSDASSNDPIKYAEELLHDLVERRLLSLQHRFANDLQVVSARFTSTSDYDEIDKDECLIITEIPRVESEKLIELICKLTDAAGVRLTPQRIIRSTLNDSGSVDDHSTANYSFIIKFDTQTTRQFILNNYLNSIMRPIVVPTKSKSWQVGGGGGGDAEPNSTTCLLPQQSTSGNSSIYMFEYLSPHNQTLLVKSVNSYDSQLQQQQQQYMTPVNNVVHDDTHINIVPVIKISSAPLIRLASKESFDDFEGRWDSVSYLLL